jgi:hypothetical protein
MEDLWVAHQEILRTIVEERSGLGWFDELSRQLNDKKDRSAFTRGAQDLVKRHGLASSDAEISLIASLATSFG